MKKRGIGAAFMAVIGLVLVVVVILTTTYVVVRLGGVVFQDPSDQATRQNFEALVDAIKGMLEDENDKFMTEKMPYYIASNEFILVGFDKGNAKGKSRCWKEDITRPLLCGESACICLYVDTRGQDFADDLSGHAKNPPKDCKTFDGNIIILGAENKHEAPPRNMGDKRDVDYAVDVLGTDYLYENFVIYGQCTDGNFERGGDWGTKNLYVEKFVEEKDDSKTIYFYIAKYDEREEQLDEREQKFEDYLKWFEECQTNLENMISLGAEGSSEFSFIQLSTYYNDFKTCKPEEILAEDLLIELGYLYFKQQLRIEQQYIKQEQKEEESGMELGTLTVDPETQKVVPVEEKFNTYLAEVTENVMTQYLSEYKSGNYREKAMYYAAKSAHRPSTRELEPITDDLQIEEANNAVAKYSDLIANGKEGSEYVLYSYYERALVYAGLKKYDEAKQDLETYKEKRNGREEFISLQGGLGDTYLDDAKDEEEINVTDEQIDELLESIRRLKGGMSYERLLKGITTHVPDYDEKLYMTVVIRAEDRDGEPDYSGSEETLKHYTNVLRVLGKKFNEREAVINFQPSLNFVEGVKAYDPGFFQEFSLLGHAVDVHEADFVINLDLNNDGHNDIKSFSEYDDAWLSLAQDGIIASPVIGGFEFDFEDSSWVVLLQQLKLFKAMCCARDSTSKLMSDKTGYAWKPSPSNWRWPEHTLDLVYIGQNLAADEPFTPSNAIIQQALNNIRGDRVNTFYGFDSLSDFKADSGTDGIAEEWQAAEGDSSNWETRIELWETWIDKTVTPLLDYDLVEWKTLEQMYDIYVENN